MNSPKPVRPWDLFNKNMNRVPSDIRMQRLEICRSCPFFISATQQCTKCGCIMPQKTKLADAYCPVHKWDVYVVDSNDTEYKHLLDEEDDE